MAFRVYDIDKKKWLKENIYLSPNDELFLLKRGLFGTIKVPLDAERYVFHKDIYVYDKKNRLVYEGDYIKAIVGKVNENDENSEDIIEIGLICYAPKLSMYIMLCVNSDVWYSLGSNVSSVIEVIGNVFDGYKEEKKDGKPTLSKPKE